MTVQIPLTQGAFALIDEADEDVVRRYTSWRVIVSPSRYRPSFYARGSRPGDPFKPLMHKLITDWKLVDHINGNGLDNRRENLRAATRGQNGANRRKIVAYSSRFKGVSVYPQDRSRWLASIAYDGRKYHLGIFTNEVEAALAYDAVARRRWGEFAALNFPGPGETGALAAA